MLQMQDLAALRDIPGYNAIIKAVFKSLIQGLLEQLSEQTGEESVILTASVNDGTLSHLGSVSGKDFLEGRDEIKSQFLKHCLKKHHYKSTPTAEPQEVTTSRRNTFEGVLSTTENSSGIRTNSPKLLYHPYSRPKKARSAQLSYDHPQSTSTLASSSGILQTDSQSTENLSSFGLPEGTILKIQASQSQTVASETGSSYGDQEDNNEGNPEETQSISNIIIKAEPDDNDVSITSMEPGRQSDFSESWTAGYGDMQEYGQAAQGTSEFADETYDYVRVQVIGQPWDHTYNEGETLFVATKLPDDYQQVTPASSHKRKVRSHKKKVRSHKLKVRLKCDLCDKDYADRVGLDRHKDAHDGKRYYCIYCPRSFAQSNPRNYHVKHLCKERPTTAE